MKVRCLLPLEGKTDRGLNEGEGCLATVSEEGTCYQHRLKRGVRYKYSLVVVSSL